MESTSSVQEQVKEKYGNAARAVAESSGVQACCDPGLRCCDPITSNLYGADQTGIIPEKAVRASLGCGNPTALIDLRPGEIVLDLGSGGGIDVLLSAQRVGPTGKAYGLDMTDEMLALARENQRQAGVTNVEFLKGEIENIPLPDNSVDVIISNCVINLSADKSRVLREAFRVLKPGGRFAVSDVVVRGSVPEEVRKSMLLWVGCIAGALEESEYLEKLKSAGFESATVEPTRVYNIEDARRFLIEAGVDVDAIASEVNEKFFSAFIRANKPQGRPAVVRRAVAELVGTAFLLAAVVGSGIMAERLAGGNVAIALLANTIATGAALVALILAFGPISGAHLNPVVTLGLVLQGEMTWRELQIYVSAQIAGAFLGVAVAHTMFGYSFFFASVHARSGAPQLLSEFVATFGLLIVIWSCARSRTTAVPYAVGAYITAAYWFTASTSFANPAVTLARAASDTFAGIRPIDVPGFIAAQLGGGIAATLLSRWFCRTPQSNDLKTEA